LTELPCILGHICNLLRLPGRYNWEVGRCL
jgi:hypothetical protein